MTERVRLLLATRSPGKVRELREILAAWPAVELEGLDAAGFPESAEEDALEAFATFEENALAKARWFAGRTGRLTLAEDSGICVDALGGAPGVHSRRFAPDAPERGVAQDQANNALLLERLAGIPEAGRTARYVCAAALAWPDGREAVFRGECEGVVLTAPRGTGGFGYDPLFYLPEEKRTFGELPAERKNEVSHRGKAVRQAVRALARG
ncbi:MAG TPA: RdgB/HAM1 family non-canonical purine NTP pyrophosphatase [Longimicrobiaceae bacterium]|nr:RdgB/HAM1 family non-canonical purine NTP pyrophosphatase [Longimicrobiaceae bacterium]